MNDIDDVYRDARIAGLYDLFNPWMACDDFYLDRTTRRAGAVLDVGCGTGMLACRIAAAGIVVVGVDPAEGMLSVARSRSGAECVEWIHSKAEDLDVDRRFRTIYMTGHAFQALIDDETAVASLCAMVAHLEPDGMVLFETRNPLRRAWECWKPNRARARMAHASLGPIIETLDATYEGGTGIAQIRHEYLFESTGEVLVGSSQVRFRDREHVATLVCEAGLAVDACLGDWSGVPFSADKKEIIIVASVTP